MGNSQFIEQDWYDTPHYYDMIFAADTALECNFLEAMHTRYGSGALARILEPACGSGRLVEEMARRGCAVSGFDQSVPMLKYAEDRLQALGMGAILTKGDLAQFSVGSDFDLAHCFVSTFKYLLDEKAARSHLQCVAAALRPGGLYVLGFHLSDYNHTGRSRERWFAQDNDTQVICNIQSWPADRTLRREALRSRLYIRHGKKEHATETHWQFRTYDAAQARQLLRSVPSLQHVATYDFTYNAQKCRDFDDNQLDCVLILRRKST